MRGPVLQGLSRSFGVAVLPDFARTERVSVLLLAVPEYGRGASLPSADEGSNQVAFCGTAIGLTPRKLASGKEGDPDNRLPQDERRVGRLSRAALVAVSSCAVAMRLR
jgi:hypothetical protein